LAIGVITLVLWQWAMMKKAREMMKDIWCPVTSLAFGDNIALLSEDRIAIQYAIRLANRSLRFTPPSATTTMKLSWCISSQYPNRKNIETAIVV
jgi:hypothetical protein